MKAVVVGASGLIGSHVAARLLNDGWAVTGLARDVRAAARRFPRIDWCCGDLGHMTGADWRPLLDGVDAVINCAGALQGGPGDDLEAVHVAGVLRLAHACRESGVRRFVHVSAAGVSAGRGSAFNATKLRAEQAIATLHLDWIVLRPGFVLAPAAYGGSALLRGLAGFPGFIPAASPDSVVQVVAVEDVAEAVVRSIRPATPARVSVDLVSEERTTLRDILLALRAWLGFPRARVVAFPRPFVSLASAGADVMALLGWSSPLRSTAVVQLAQGVTGDVDQAAAHLGFRPRSLSAILESHPSGVQERWFARLYLLKPVLLVGLVLFWAASDRVISIGRRGIRSRLQHGRPRR